MVRVWMRVRVTKRKGQDDKEDGLCLQGYQTNLGREEVEVEFEEEEEVELEEEVEFEGEEEDGGESVDEGESDEEEGGR